MGGYHVVVSFAQPDENLWCECHKATIESIANLDEDLKDKILDVVVLRPSDPLVQSVVTQAGMFGGGLAHAVRSQFSNNYVVGLPIVPPGYYITAGYWSDETMRKEWDKASEQRDKRKDLKLESS